MAGLDYAGGDTQRKTKCHEVPIYLYSFSKLKTPRTFKWTIKIITKLSPEMEIETTPKPEPLSYFFEISC